MAQKFRFIQTVGPRSSRAAFSGREKKCKIQDELHCFSHTLTQRPVTGQSLGKGKAKARGIFLIFLDKSET
jgi:hypothetical protein